MTEIGTAMVKRHPGGRTCQMSLPLAVLMMPYAIVRELWMVHQVYKNSKNSKNAKNTS